MKKRILRECLQIARSNVCKHDQPFIHFSFVIHNNKIVEWGKNMSGNPPKYFGYPKWSKIHSEISAVKKAKGLIKGEPFSMVNIRTNRRGSLRNSKPCPSCQRFLKELKCLKITFSYEGGFK